jgi:hypothetical protein
MSYSFEIGTTPETMTNLASLSPAIPAPKVRYRPYSKLLNLGNGLTRGAGWAVAEWRWGFLSQAQRDKLRTFCTGASAQIYIKTKTNDNSDAYKTFSCVVDWPIESEERDTGRRIDFILSFKKLVEVT